MDKILNYWYQLEFFAPNWPVNEREDINLSKNGLPWPKEAPENEQISFEIYFGKTKSEDMIKWMIQELTLAADEKIEPDHSLACLCACKVDDKGQYIPDSFAISPFVWAICQFIKNGFGSELNIDEMRIWQESVNSSLKDDDGEPAVLTLEDLDTLYVRACSFLGIREDLVEHCLWSKEKGKRGET